MTIIYILLGIMALALAVFLIKALALLVGPSLVFGFITWLLFDSFWLGCIIGAFIPIIGIIRSPRRYFEDLLEEAGTFAPTSSGNSKSSNSSKQMIKDKYGNWREVSTMDSTTAYDDYGHKYTNRGGVWYCDD